jgi:hypothetical protein
MSRTISFTAYLAFFDFVTDDALGRVEQLGRLLAVAARRLSQATKM